MEVLTINLYKYKWKTVPPLLQIDTWYPAMQQCVSIDPDLQC